MNVSVVISYCSLDKRFIETTVRECLVFSDDIIIVGFDHLLNGDPEDTSMLDTIRATNGEKIRAIILPYESNHNPRHHHNTARWEGQKLSNHEHVLFLDADEIPEGSVAKDILHHPDMPEIHSLSFSCYWYFRSAKNRDITTESSPMMINKKYFTRNHYFTDGERWGFAWGNPNYIEGIKGPNGAFFHHYSWARTKEEMLIKTASWGHKNDRDWKSLINEEFGHEFNGTDFVHGYKFITVDDHFNLGI